MKKQSLHEAERWLKQARRDLDDAEFARSGGRYNLACFVAQQAAEKAIKAYLYSRRAELVLGHSVAELCTDAEKLDPDFKTLRELVGSLDRYYIPTRYPNGLPGGIPADAFNQADADSAVAQASRAIEFVAARCC